MGMKIYESGENYLETMFILNKEKGYIKAVDVASKLNFSKPSVSRAVSILKKLGYLNVTCEGLIVLTEFGLQVAKKIYERHCFLTEYFKFLGVSDATAKKDACRVEHAMSKETFEKLKEHFKKIKH